MNGTFGERAGNMQGTFRAHSGNIQGTFRAHSGHIQGTFRAQLGNIQGTPQVLHLGARAQVARFLDTVAGKINPLDGFRSIYDSIHCDATYDIVFTSIYILRNILVVVCAHVYT
jgi:hypothetical protein